MLGRVPAALPVGPRRCAAELRAVAAAAAPGAPPVPPRGCSWCPCAAYSWFGRQATLSPLVRRPRAPVAVPSLRRGGGRRALTCAGARPLSRATARRPPQPPLRFARALRCGRLSSLADEGVALSARQGACPRSESLPARRSRLAAPLPLSHAAAATVSLRATRRSSSPAANMYGGVAVCSAIRRADGSAPLLVPAPGEWAWQCPLPSVGRARLPPLATCCRPGRGAVRCRGGGSASGIGCSSRRALWRRCPVACPLHCLYARDDLRPSSELPPALVHRARRCYRAVAWLLALPLRCPRAARRAGDTIAARAPAAGARHHPASLGGGAASARVCVRLDRSRGRRRGRRHRRRST